MALNKFKVVEQIQSHLAEELSSLLPAAEEAEAGRSPLPEETGARIQEIRQQLTMYRFLPRREFGAEDVICPGTLVELELAGRQAFYFVVPMGGGLVMRIEGKPVQVITPQSPLGEALLGRKVGDSVSVGTTGGSREYRVVSLS